MILALDSLHSMTRWQHMAMNMLKTMRGSSPDVTTWTHIKETKHFTKFTDDSAPTYRWLQFTLVHGFILYSYLLGGGRKGGREGGCGRPLQSQLAPSRKRKKKIQRKNCCTSVITQSPISPSEAALVSSQPNTAEPWGETQGTDDHQMNKYHSRISIKSFPVPRCYTLTEITSNGTG